MDSKDIPPPPPHQSPPGIQMSHYRNNPNAAALMGHPGAFQSIHYQAHYGSLALQQHHSQALQQQESLGFGDGSPSSQPIRFGIEQNQGQQQVTRKRGRPRKYASEGNTALGLASTSPLLSGRDGGGGGEDNAASTEPPAKRKGRPPGSGKKRSAALGGTPGKGFTPHVIEVNSGEDIASRMMAFSEEGPRTVCILSGSGAVSSVTLTQVSNPSDTITSKKRFEIITLAGSFTNYEVDGSTQRTGRLTVALAGSDGQMLGGVVVGPLIAATQVQVTVVSFVREPPKVKKSKGRGKKTQGQKPEPASAPANMLNFGSNSQGPTSESSGENESGSPLVNRDNNNNNSGNFGNSVSQQQQQQQQQQMYSWFGQGR